MLVAEGFERGTFLRLAKALLDGSLPAHSVEAHRFGDLARNINRTPNNFRFTTLHKGFCSYWYLLGSRAYRGARGGPSVDGTGGKPVLAGEAASRYNLLDPSPETLEEYLRLNDPDAAFRLGFSSKMLAWFFKVDAELSEKAGNAEGAECKVTSAIDFATRLGFDGTHIRPMIEFLHGIIYGAASIPGSDDALLLAQQDYTKLHGPLYSMPSSTQSSGKTNQGYWGSGLTSIIE